MKQDDQFLLVKHTQYTNPWNKLVSSTLPLATKISSSMKSNQIVDAMGLIRNQE